MSHDDDDTVPTGRAGADPLIAFPSRSTGTTGQIERPGDQTPWWFIPGMFAVAVFFIVLWAAISESRSGDDSGESTRGTAEEARSAPTASDPAASEASAASTTAAPTTVDPLIEALPPPGVVRVGDREFDIVARCEVHTPYEPVDTATQVSSYFFFDQSGQRGVVERVVDGESDRATRLIDGTVTSSSEVTSIGDEGAFSAEFVGSLAIVNPPAAGSAQCADRVVTNAPGQFAEPHTQIVLDVCLLTGGPNGTTISGLTSEGSRFEIQQAGGELAEIVFERGPDDVLRTSAPATILRADDTLAASGVVSNGVDDLDISIDIGSAIEVADGRPCGPTDLI
jgi:hypothetical protein